MGRVHPLESWPLTRWSLLISPPVDRPAIVSWSAPSGIISVCHRIIIRSILIISWLYPDYNPDYPDYILIPPLLCLLPSSTFLHASPIFDQSESAQHEIQITFSFAKRWLHSSSCQSASNGRGNKNIFFQDAPPSTSSLEKCRIWKHFGQTKTVM